MIIEDINVVPKEIALPDITLPTKSTKTKSFDNWFNICPLWTKSWYKFIGALIKWFIISLWRETDPLRVSRENKINRIYNIIEAIIPKPRNTKKK